MDERELSAARAQLARFAVPRRRHDAPVASEVLTGLMAVLEASPDARSALDKLDLPRLEDVALDDLWTALKLIPDERLVLNATERLVIETLKDRHVTWGDIGGFIGVSRQGAKKRYEQTLRGTRTWHLQAVESSARAGALIRLRLAVEGAADAEPGAWRVIVLTEVITSVLADKTLTEDEILAAHPISEAIMDKAMADVARGRIVADEVPRDLDTVEAEVLSTAMSAWANDIAAKSGGDRLHLPVRQWNRLEPGIRNYWIESAQESHAAAAETAPAT
ncbi:MAG: hypothetical protein QOF58_3252 [Pseudonocardiales bacterium]|jgi:hypothetical protein|nr:hypothetical protein [Pseudonocardiales bacterium]